MRETATFSEALFNCIIWGLLCVLLFPVLKKPYILPKNKKYIVCFLLFVFCLYPFFAGDYFHYNVIYNETKQGFSRGLEDFYKWIILNICNSYTFFRIIVWGGALWLTLSAYKRIRPLDGLSITFFSLLYLPWFSYARVSLAMASIFMGLCLIVKPINRRHFLSYTLGLLIMCCSVFFHRTAIIGIIAAFGSFLLKNPNKKKLLIIMALFPLSILILKSLLSNFLTLDLDYDTYVTGQQRDLYLSSDETASGLSIGIGPYISVFLTRAPLFLIGFAYIYSIWKGVFCAFQKPVQIISSYAFIIILIALAFSFNLGVNTYVFYYRSLNFAMIPSAVFLAQLRYYGIMPTLYKWIYYSTLWGVVYTLVYSIYCSFFI